MNNSWVSGREIMDRLGLLAQEVALLAFIGDIEVVDSITRDDQADIMQVLVAEWSRANKDVFDRHGRWDPDEDKEFWDDVEAKTPKIDIDARLLFLNLIPDLQFSKKDLIKAEAALVAAGLKAHVFSPEQRGEHRDLSTRERQTHQVIIAALCKKAGIDLEARGATTKISHALDEIGITTDDGTIRKILKEIPESIESRTR